MHQLIEWIFAAAILLAFGVAFASSGIQVVETVGTLWVAMAAFLFMCVIIGFKKVFGL